MTFKNVGLWERSDLYEVSKSKMLARENDVPANGIISSG